MIFVLTLCFLLLHLLPLLVLKVLPSADSRPADTFGPIWVLTALNLLTLPYLLLLSADLGYLSPEVGSSPWVRDVAAALARYVVAASLGFLALVLGVLSPLGRQLALHLPRLDVGRFTPRRCFRAILFTAGGGIAAYMYFLSQIGGLRNLWMVLYNRTLVTASTGYISTLYALLLTFAALLLVYSLRFRMTWMRRATVVVSLIAVAAVLASTGGRSGAVTLVIFAMLTIHYGVRRINRMVTPRTMLVAAVLFFFVLVMPLFRTARSFERYSAAPSLIITDALARIDHVAPQLSGLDRGLVIVSYFTADRVWWGQSYLDLILAPVPRSMMPQKPPVDEGVYLMAIAVGNEVQPSMPARDLPVTSWPMGNWILYMNFGLPGFLVGMFASGVLIGTVYRYMWVTGFTPFSIYLYGFGLMGGFSWSNYSIVLLLMTLVITSVVFFAIFGRNPRLARARNGFPAGAS